MKTFQRAFLLSGLLMAAAGLRAQEPWGGGFKLTAASFPGAEDAYLGQSRAFGLAIFGTYPLGRAGRMSFEGGYKYLPSTNHVAGSTSYEDKSDGYYGSAFYQHKLWIEGFHLQAGLRLAQYVAARRTSFRPGDGSSVLTKVRGDYASTVKPVLGAGYQLTAKYGLELNLAATEMRNVSGQVKSGTMVELALLIHL